MGCKLLSKRKSSRQTRCALSASQENLPADGKQRELFDYRKTEEAFDRVKEILPDYEKWAKLMIFDGTHEFCKDDAPIEKLVADIQ